MAREKAPKAAGEEKTITYLPPGVGVSPERPEPTLDPALAEIRDREAEANAKVEVAPLGEPTIDPALVKARDEQIKRENERAGVKSDPTPAKQSSKK